MKAVQFWVVGLLHNKWTKLGKWCRQMESTGTAAAAVPVLHGSAFVCGMDPYPPILCHELFLKLQLVLLLKGLKCTRVQALK